MEVLKLFINNPITIRVVSIMGVIIYLRVFAKRRIRTFIIFGIITLVISLTTGKTMKEYLISKSGLEGTLGGGVGNTIIRQDQIENTQSNKIIGNFDTKDVGTDLDKIKNFMESITGKMEKSLRDNL